MLRLQRVAKPRCQKLWPNVCMNVCMNRKVNRKVHSFTKVMGDVGAVSDPCGKFSDVEKHVLERRIWHSELGSRIRIRTVVLPTLPSKTKVERKQPKCECRSCEYSAGIWSHSDEYLREHDGVAKRIFSENQLWLQPTILLLYTTDDSVMSVVNTDSLCTFMHEFYLYHRRGDSLMCKRRTIPELLAEAAQKTHRESSKLEFDDNSQRYRHVWTFTNPLEPSSSVSIADPCPAFWRIYGMAFAINEHSAACKRGKIVELSLGIFFVAAVTSAIILNSHE